jgi:hypothetical protein
VDGHLLTPVIDLTDIMLRYEFGKSPGGIFHGVGFSQSEMDQRLDEALSQLGRTVDGAVKKVEWVYYDSIRSSEAGSGWYWNVGGGDCVAFGGAEAEGSDCDGMEGIWESAFRVGAAGCCTRLGSSAASDDMVKKGDVMERKELQWHDLTTHIATAAVTIVGNSRWSKLTMNRQTLNTLKIIHMWGPLMSDETESGSSSWYAANVEWVSDTAQVGDRKWYRWETSMYKVVSRFMGEINKAKDVPKDEALFFLAGGKLVMNQRRFDCVPSAVSGWTSSQMMEPLLDSDLNRSWKPTGNER